MRIAICDDEKNIRAYIRRLIEKQGGENDIAEYASGEELLAAVRDADLDLLFLDIAMDDIDGMSVAERLRKMQADKGQAAWGSLPLLIFVTGFSEYMPAAFSVSAFQFMVKPIDETNFEKVYKHAIDEYYRIQKKFRRNEKKITLRSGSNMFAVRAGDILYIESRGHKNRICLQKSNLEYYGKISELEQDLVPDFFRIHRGYLINLNYVNRYDRADVHMENGDRLPLSRQKYREFVESYLKYIVGDNFSEKEDDLQRSEE